MGGVFYSLGRMVGPKVRKAKWVFRSMTGSESDALQAEFEVGRDMAHEVERQVELDREPQVQELLSEVGDRLTDRLTNRRRVFTFRATRVPEINAYALPGGFVFVTRTLIELCGRDRHEMAFILGHEMAHIVRGHAIDRIINSSVINVASRVGVAGRAMRHKVVQAGLGMLRNAYSQDQELEADAFAARLAHSASFDPSGGLHVLERLRRQSDVMSDSVLGEYFSSHPPFDLRMTRLNRLIKGRTR